MTPAHQDGGTMGDREINRPFEDWFEVAPIGYLTLEGDGVDEIEWRALDEADAVTVYQRHWDGEFFRVDALFSFEASALGVTSALGAARGEAEGREVRDLTCAAA
jgi:hypothetical protein